MTATLRVGSLFSGIGGFELGFEAAGAETVFTSEIDKGASAVLAHHFPHIPNLGDIKEIGSVPTVDVLTGGFPCQDLSVAGRRAGLAGDRSGLFWEFCRIVESARPRWFVLENVPGLFSSDGGRDFGIVARALADLGYGIAWRVLDAQFFGVPQRRRRVFIVGCLGDPARAGQVLLEPEGGCWDPPPRPAPGTETASAVGLGVALRGRDAGATAELGDSVAFGLRASQGGGDKPYVLTQAVSTLQAGGGERGYRVDAESAAGGHLIPVAFHVTQDPISGDVSPALSSNAYIGVATCQKVPDLDAVVSLRVRRLTPRLTANGVGTCGADDNQAQAGHLIPVTYQKVIRSGARDKDGNLPPEVWAERDVAATLSAFDAGGESRAIELVVGPEFSTALQSTHRGVPSSEEVSTRAGAEWGGQVPVQGLRVRRLTPRECERLQGFPDDWTLVPARTLKNGDVRVASDSARYKQLGNAVAVPVVEWIARRIAEVAR